MYKRFKDSLESPKKVFMYANDSFWRIFGYILIMSFLLSLPVTITALYKPELLFPSTSALESKIKANFIEEDYKIVDGKFINEGQNKFFTLGYFSYSFSKVNENNDNFYHIVFEEETLSFYIGNRYMMNKYNSISYKDLEMENMEFTLNNAGDIASKIQMINNGGVATLLVFQSFLEAMLDFLFMALLFTLFTLIFLRLPIKFKILFKFSVYLLTGWVSFILLARLFGLSEILFLDAIIICIYYYLAFKSVKIIKKEEIK